MGQQVTIGAMLDFDDPSKTTLSLPENPDHRGISVKMAKQLYDAAVDRAFQGDLSIYKAKPDLSIARTILKLNESIS